MNTTPNLHGKPVLNSGCGYLAMQNRAMYWWQSRHRLDRPPQLTNLAVLAQAIRQRTAT